MKAKHSSGISPERGLLAASSLATALSLTVVAAAAATESALSSENRFVAPAPAVAAGATKAASIQSRLPVEGRLPSLDGATGWLNSTPLTSKSLRGKVVLVEFWTYSCINWLRTLPYVRAWAEKYRDQGLVVIGVHTPEFGFEKQVENIRQAVKDRRIDYPVAIDSDYAVWRAFENNSWPALYVVDAQGRIRHHHAGEGDYEKSEIVIQQLLAEAGHGSPGHSLVTPAALGAEVAADWDDLRSGENYVGYDRTENFASRGGATLGRHRVYIAPEKLRLNQWALAGEWTFGREAAVLDQPNGSIFYRFHARDVHVVMGGVAAKTAVRFRVRIDGQPPGAAHGTDVDEQGYGTVTDHRLYQLIRQTGPIADRQFEIEFLAAGVEAFSFTFG